MIFEYCDWLLDEMLCWNDKQNTSPKFIWQRQQWSDLRLKFGEVGYCLKEFNDEADIVWIYLVCGQAIQIRQKLKLMVQDRQGKVDRL